MVHVYCHMLSVFKTWGSSGETTWWDGTNFPQIYALQSHPVMRDDFFPDRPLSRFNSKQRHKHAKIRTLQDQVRRFYGTLNSGQKRRV